MRKLLLAVALFWAGAAGAAEEGQAARAVRVRGAVTLDGSLDEADWAAAPQLDRFVEYYPADRGPPPERTSARFLYDDRFLYVGLRAELRDLTRLRTPFVRRDKVGASHDYLQVYIDPLGARRNAYIFRVNARGVKTDGLQNEAAQSETTDPDYDWDVATHIDKHGWTAEMRIPLSTLRVARIGPQRWWVIVTRGVPRENNTQIATARFPHFSSCFLCYASPLSFPDLTPKTETLILTPSLTLRNRRDAPRAAASGHIAARLSLDAKWLPYPGGAVDLALRPDFSQVEADSPQLTANARFAIDVPEKRSFFREGLDLVQTPIAALSTRAVVAPDLGLRLTHRSEALNGTAFIARDVGGGAIIEPGLLSSSIGYPTSASEVAFVHVKASMGPAADGGVLGAVKRNEDGSFNAVAGVDASWGSAGDRVTAQLLTSRTRDPDRPDLLPTWLGESASGAAISMAWRHTGQNVWVIRYQRYGPGFRSWLGYVPRVGYQQADVDLRRPLHPGRMGLNDLAPYVDYTVLTPLDRGGREGGPAFGLAGDGGHNLNFDIALHPRAEVLTEQGDVRRLSYGSWSVFMNPHPRIPLLKLSGVAGEGVDFATGEVARAQALALTVQTRPMDRLDLTVSLSGDQLGGDPSGGTRLRETAVELIGVWFFGPALYLSADFQRLRADRRYPQADKSASSLLNVQFSWTSRRDLQAFWGVRSGAERAANTGAHSRSTEVFLKVSRTLGARL